MRMSNESAALYPSRTCFHCLHYRAFGSAVPWRGALASVWARAARIRGSLRYYEFMKTLAIIGGGAAGLAAAVEAARESRRRSARMEITVYEASDRVGKSILATGNGRCNLSNSAIDAAVYRNAEFVREAYRALPPEKVRSSFADLGLVMREEAEGRIYPLTNKATSVLDVLRFAIRESGVRESCGTEVVAVTPVEERFLVCFADGGTVFADAVILACGGGPAQSLLPPAYPYAGVLPVLGPLKTDVVPIKGLNNIRVRCEVSLYGRPCESGDKAAGRRKALPSPSLKACEAGEVLFRDYGVSGIAIFDLSRFAEAGDVLSLDLVPETREDALAADLSLRVERFGSRGAVELLSGMLLAPVARAVCASIGMRADDPVARGRTADLACAVKSFRLEVRGAGDVRQCQVSRGGFEVAPFSPDTMESRLHAGLYVVGEALDIDAPCGGYNLHWAWTSGALAGRAAAGRCAP